MQTTKRLILCHQQEEAREEGKEKILNKKQGEESERGALTRWSLTMTLHMRKRGRKRGKKRE